jgi:hypothetical protein
MSSQSDRCSQDMMKNKNSSIINLRKSRLYYSRLNLNNWVGWSNAEENKIRSTHPRFLRIIHKFY